MIATDIATALIRHVLGPHTVSDLEISFQSVVMEYCFNEPHRRMCCLRSVMMEIVSIMTDVVGVVSIQDGHVVRPYRRCVLVLSV